MLSAESNWQISGKSFAKVGIFAKFDTTISFEKDTFMLSGERGPLVTDKLEVLNFLMT